tara:strand:- start:1427 stop:1990 length:564 start_codon:yes stop_codon:yes gene_type:complete
MKIVDLDKPEVEPLEFRDRSFIDRVTQDYIRQFKNLLTAEECKEIIGMYKFDQWQTVKKDDIKVCDVIAIKPGAIDDLLMDKFSKMMYLYAKDYPRAASFNVDVGYTLVRTTMEHYCPIHHEPSGNSITAMIYLNDDCEGGELQFFNREKTESSVGGCVIFPSAFMFPHETLPVTEGIRYSVYTQFK